MGNTIDTALIFAFLGFFHFWGGAAFGAGLRGRRWPAAVWGLLIGGAPLYFGIERGTDQGGWGALVWQVAVFAVSALAVGLALPRFRAVFLRDGMTSLTVGTFLMAAGAIVGAWFFRLGSEMWSLIAGGIGFLFGAMWFGAGLKKLRGR